MDVHDGGSGSRKGPNTSKGAETEKRPAQGSVPRPRTAGSAPPEPVRGERAGSEPGLPGERAESRPALRAEPTGPEPGSPLAPSEPEHPLRAEPVSVRPAAEPSDGLVSEVPLPGPRTGVAALSLRYRVAAALALAVVAVALCVHVGMVFLHVAPSNTVTKAHGKAIDDWIYPEFEQNWKLFAPNPLQQNIAVQVRAQVRTVDGGSRTTGWYDLSAQDGRAIDGNLLPSHTQQNELRRAWDFFTATHNNDNRPVGIRGALSETYLRHIVVLRLERGGAAGEGGVVERIQVRSQTTNVTPPKWSNEKVSMSPVYRELSWWSVPDGETEGGTR